MDKINEHAQLVGTMDGAIIASQPSLIDLQQFKDLFYMWVFSFVSSFWPILFYFFLGNTEFSFRELFRNAEILYMCVLMAVVSFNEMRTKKEGIRFHLTLLIILIGGGLYTAILSGPPSFIEYANRLSNLNKSALALVFTMGVWGYWKACKKMRIRDYLKHRKEEVV